jgi:hypothetical protein
LRIRNTFFFDDLDIKFNKKSCKTPKNKSRILKENSSFYVFAHIFLCMVFFLEHSIHSIHISHILQDIMLENIKKTIYYYIYYTQQDKNKNKFWINRKNLKIEKLNKISTNKKRKRTFSARKVEQIFFKSFEAKKKQRKRFKNFWVIFYMSELSFNFFYFISFFQKALKNSNYCVYVRIIHCKDN